MGSALARAFGKGPYRLLLFGHDPTRLDKLAEKISSATNGSEIETISCSSDACWEADIIILAIPHTEETELAASIEKFTTRKIVISISNAADQNPGNVSGKQTSAAEELQQVLPHAIIVKAFSDVSANEILEANSKGLFTDTWIAGNDEEALDTVRSLVITTGLNPLIAGDLSLSNNLEIVTRKDSIKQTQP